MNKDKLKYFQNEFKLRVNDEKLYQGVYKVFSQELKLFEPFFVKQSDLEKNHQSLFLERLDRIHEDHQILYDKYLKANKVIVAKNTDEIESQHQLLLLKQDEIKIKFDAEQEQIINDRLSLKKNVEAQINDAKLRMQREIFDFEKRYKTYRDENLNMVDDIEKEYKDTEEKLKANFKKQKEHLIDQKQEIDVVKTDSTKLKLDEQDELTKLNNDYYISIKQTFNDTNVAINQKISALNKSYQSSITKLDKELDKINQPILDNIKELKETYEKRVDELKNEFALKLESFDQAFEQVTIDYKAKREKFIHESGEAISIFNSKLTNSRETIDAEKLTITRTYRDLMKDMDETESKKVFSEMKRKIRTLEHELNNNILQTRKDINKMKRDHQTRLTEEENKFIYDRYEWRLNKLLLSNQYHHNMKKLDLNFQYNLEFARQKHQLNNDHNMVKKEIMSHTLNQDATPLETQMMIQNLIQERELNLLNNDQEIALNELKIELFNIEHTYDIAAQELDYLEQKNQLDLDSELLVLNSNVQLELEKSKIKREENQKDYQLRKTLSETSFNKQKYMLDTEYELKNAEWLYAEDVLDIETQDKHFYAKRKETLMYQKRSYFMRDADLTTKSRIQQNEAIKEIRVYENDTLNETHAIESLTNMFVFAHERLLTFKKLINDIYHLPAHPEVFKKLLLLGKEYFLEINQMLNEAIDQKELKIMTYLDKQKNDIFHYKHALKHETYQYFYQNNIDQFDIDINRFEDEILDLGNFILTEQASIEKHQNFINQLNKILTQSKSGVLNLDSYEIKENIKLIKRHEKAIKTIKYKMRIYEKEISKNHHSINFLSYKRQHMTRRMRLEDYQYKKRLKHGAKVYDRYEKSYHKMYQKMKNDLSVFVQGANLLEHFINQKAYITEQQMKDQMYVFNKKIRAFSANILFIQEKQIALIKDYYLMHRDKEAIIIQDIKTHENRASKLLKQSAELFSQSVKMMLKEQEKLTTSSLKLAKHNFIQSTKQTLNQISKESLNFKSMIHDQEEQIHKLTKQVDQQLNTINQNQHEIALQYLNDTEEKRHHLNELHKKKLKNLSLMYQKKIDDFIHSNEQLDKKNQLLLSKFKEKEKQTLILHHQKLTHISEKISASHKKMKHMEQTYQKDQRSYLRERDYHFRELNYALKKQNKITSSKEQVSLKKDLTEERLSYRFKLKKLKLD